MVGWTADGEWFEYTLNVATAGTYTLTLRTTRAPSGNGMVRILFDGVDKTGNVAVPSTGSWSVWANVVIPNVSLSAGQQVMRVEIVTSEFDTNWIEFVRSTVPTPTPAAGGQTTYGNNGQPWTIAASGTTRIQAENYDQGGEGVAYHDTDTTNNGGAYRTSEWVDVVGMGDAGGGGHKVGWTADGEWLEYTVNVATAQTFDLRLRVSRGTTGNGSLRIRLDGVDKTGLITITPTGDWELFTDVVVNNVTLAAGQQVMRVEVVVGAFDLNWVEFTPSSAPTSTPTPPPNSFDLIDAALARGEITRDQAATYKIYTLFGMGSPSVPVQYVGETVVFGDGTAIFLDALKDWNQLSSQTQALINDFITPKIYTPTVSLPRQEAVTSQHSTYLPLIQKGSSGAPVLPQALQPGIQRLRGMLVGVQTEYVQVRSPYGILTASVTSETVIWQGAKTIPPTQLQVGDEVEILAQIKIDQTIKALWLHVAHLPVQSQPAQTPQPQPMSGASVAAAWQPITQLEAGRNPSLAIDNQGNVYIFWASDNGVGLRYARRDGATGNWSTTATVPGSTGDSEHPSIAIDSQNTLHLVWNEVVLVNDNVMYSIRYRSATWANGNLTWVV